MKLKRPSGLPHKIPAWAWKRLVAPARRPQAGPHRLPSWFWAWRRWRLVRKPKPKPIPPTKMFMFDDVSVSLIPKDAQAVAGYVDGHWHTWLAVNKGWPKAKKLPIAVFGQDNGDCLDVEPDDASVLQAPGWVKRQLAHWNGKHHDVARPVVYTAASQGQKLIDVLSKAGLKYGQDYLWWSAHYDPALGQHLCSSKCGFGIKVTAHATQFTDHANGKSLDESICSPGFFAR